MAYYDNPLAPPSTGDMDKYLKKTEAAEIYVPLYGDVIQIEAGSAELKLDSDTSLTANKIGLGNWDYGEVLAIEYGKAKYLGYELAVKSDIPDVPEDKVFVATYGETTMDEVASAIANGKNVICIYTNWTYRAVNSYRFESFDTTSGTARYLKIDSQNRWSNGSSTTEWASHKVTSLSDASTDTQYPSAKCVYDALQNAVGDVHAALQELLGGETEANA